MDFRRRLEAERHEKEKKVLVAQKEHWGDAAVGVYGHDRNSHKAVVRAIEHVAETEEQARLVLPAVEQVARVTRVALPHVPAEKRAALELELRVAGAALSAASTGYRRAREAASREIVASSQEVRAHNQQVGRLMYGGQ